MKKFLGIIAIAAFVTSCDNSGTVADKKDSLDSIKNAKVDAIDSLKNKQEEKVEQKYDSLKNVVDSTHKDTANKK